MLKVESASDFDSYKIAGDYCNNHRILKALDIFNLWGLRSILMANHALSEPYKKKVHQSSETIALLSQLWQSRLPTTIFG